MSQNSGNPTTVPNVPGAFGAKPLPKPSAKKCAGCETNNLHVGWVCVDWISWLIKVIKSLFGDS